MSPPETRKRDADATRDAILKAAQRVFTSKGYDAARLRDIAAEAGCNVALINRYFGSKDGLFQTAVLDTFATDDFAKVPIDLFATVIGQLMATKTKDDQDLDPTMVMMRSAGSPDILAQFKDVVQDCVVDPLAEKLGGPDAQERATTIAAIILGFDASRRIFKMNGLQGDASAPLIAAFQAIIDMTANPMGDSK